MCTNRKNRILQILEGWLTVAGQKDLTEHFKMIWLMSDYVEGNVFTPQFYAKHEAEILAFLDKLDATKPDVQEVKAYFQPQKQEELF